MNAALACGAVVVVAEPLTIPVLRRIAAIDVPGLRSSHTVPTPRGGGAPIAAGLLVAAAMMGGGEMIPFAFGVGYFALIGLIDDLRGLAAGRRLMLQGAGSVVVATLLALQPVVDGLPTVVLTSGAILAAIWVIGFVNVFNFMDGVNGISAAHAVVGGVAYACFGEWAHTRFLAGAGLAVAVAGLAFLPWNAGRARVFLGDVGSYALGASLAVLAATALSHGVPAEAAFGPLALYIADTAWTLQRRIRAGEPWLQAHRTHIYQRWCDVGWTHQEVAVVTAGSTVLLSLLGAVSLARDPMLRIGADVAGLGVLVGYLRSPVFFGHPDLARPPAMHRRTSIRAGSR
jgi:UDP-N-acetylmuramyl pentapeptide phosphotransferase/UDP-N-acetylglucosamine-1-phosphate transferase